MCTMKETIEDTYVYVSVYYFCTIDKEVQTGI